MPKTVQHRFNGNCGYQENEKITRVLKLQIYPTPEQSELLSRTMKQFMLACDYLSFHAFADGDFSDKQIQKNHYHAVRDLAGLPSQMAISACHIVAASYKTVNEQLKASPACYPYEDESGEKHTCVYKRDLQWLLRPLHFHTPQLLLQRNRDWCFKDVMGEELLSLNTIDGRITVPYNKALLPDKDISEWHFGAGRIVHKNKKWFFHLMVSKHIPESVTLDDVTNVVGIDRGIVNVFYSFDSNGETDNKSGAELQEKRSKFANTRRSLQHKGTKGAKRVLKRISGRENRWMHDVNHCVSKTLVGKYSKGTLLVFEDLTDVSFDSRNLHGGDRSRELRSWTFFELEQMVRYKAKERGILVANVHAEFTSQRCPECGNICKEARDRKAHLYTCPKCGYSNNDDLVGAMNIWHLGTQLVKGVANPHFSK